MRQYYPNINTQFGYQPKPSYNRYNLTGSNLKFSAEEFIPTFQPKPAENLAPPITEFIPSKELSASASDFQPLSKANLDSNAPVFEMSSVISLPAELKAEKIAEFVPETLPDEKLDDPIFIIPNRDLSAEDQLLVLTDIVITVDVKNKYPIEEILSIFKEIRTDPNFEKIPENVKEFASRVRNTITKKRGKNKDALKAEHEASEIISTTVWRKPKTEEEEKISSKAKAYKMKLTGSKEEHDKIQRSIKSTLNKLLPTNLDKLREQLLETGKQSTNNLIFLVQCIFEKAWSEVKYTSMYASLCKFLKEKFEGYVFQELEADLNLSKRNLFKYELLERCQNAFTSSGAELAGLSQEELDSKREIFKKKTLGNVRFIGELFKVGLITTKVILQCANVLVSRENIDENKLEGACILLSTGGSSFERSKLQKETEKIFKAIDEILKTEPLSSKIKFKIMDLIDERNNQWKKNFKEEVKTIQEIHQEFEQEMKKKRML